MVLCFIDDLLSNVLQVSTCLHLFGYTHNFLFGFGSQLESGLEVNRLLYFSGLLFNMELTI